MRNEEIESQGGKNVSGQGTIAGNETMPNICHSAEDSNLRERVTASLPWSCYYPV